MSYHWRPLLHERNSILFSVNNINALAFDVDICHMYKDRVLSVDIIASLKNIVLPASLSWGPETWHVNNIPSLSLTDGRENPQEA